MVTGVRVVFHVRLAILILIFGFGAHTALGQSAGATTANITGIVNDESGAVISGALITARNLQTNLIRERTTGEDGSFLLPQLPPGSYEVIAKAEGFVTKSSRLDLNLGTTTVVNFAMKVGAPTEVIEVVGNRIIEGKTESSTNIERQRIDNLPINRRNFLDFSLTAARVVADRLPVQGTSATSGLSFNGQSARFNNITIDGLDNNDLGSGAVRATFGQDAVQEFQVVSDNYSAEFGRASSGLVNIVTKGGGNEFHGNLFFFNRNDEISARDVFAPFKPDYKQYQFGSVLSGPIKRDKAFFFTSFERLSVKQNNFVTISDEAIGAANRLGFGLRNGPVPFALGITSFLGRLDAKLTPSDSIWVRYNFGGSYNGALEPFGGLTAETNGGIQRLDDSSLAVDNTYISSGLNLVNETRFLYGRRDQNVVQIADTPQVRVFAPEGQVTFGRGTFLPMPREVRVYQIVDNVSLSRGPHQIKFGGDFLYYDTPGRRTSVPLFPGGFAAFTALDFTAVTGIPNLPFFTALQAFDPALRTPQQNAFLVGLSAALPIFFPGFPRGISLLDKSLPVAYAQGFGDPRLSVPVKFFSAYVQDDIKIRPNLLLKLGARYDIGRVPFTPKNGGNIAPRVALTYRPESVPGLTVKANYGIFFNGSQLIGASFVTQLVGTGIIKVPVVPFPFSILPFSRPGHRFDEGLTVPSEINFIPQLSQTAVFQKDLRNSYGQQTGLGISYLINNNTAVSVDYQFVRGIKLLVARDINPVVRPLPLDPVTSQVIGRVDPTRGSVFEFESAFDSYYHGVTFLLNRRFANRFGLLAHYTISKAIDNFIDFRADLQEVNNSLRPKDERGLSLQDVRNRFVASGTWELSYTNNPIFRGFQVSSILNLESGRPYNLIAGVDLNMNGDNPPGDRPLGIGRNAGVAPGFASLDLRLTRTMTIKDAYKLQGIIEVFNLFNRVNIDGTTQVNRIFSPDRQGNFALPPQDGGRFILPADRFRAAFAPRQFQLGFKLTF